MALIVFAPGFPANLLLGPLVDSGQVVIDGWDVGSSANMRVGNAVRGTSSTAEVSKLEGRLTRLERACGCPEGAAASVIGTTLYGSLVLWPSLRLGHGPVAVSMLGVVGVLILSSGLGKFIGLGVARWRARRIRGQLASIRCPQQIPS